MFALLPDALLSFILTNWLDVRDVVLLDSSLCTSSARGDFLKVLHMYHPATPKNASIDSSNSWLKWCIRRQVACRTLLLGDCSAELLSNFLALCGRGITTAAFCCKSNPIPPIIQACINIMDLSLSGSAISGENILDLICGSHIRCLTLKKCDVFPLTGVDRTKLVARRPLNHIECEYSGVGDDLLCSLLPLCSFLKSLKFWACKSITNATAFAAAEHNCRVETLCVSGTRIDDAGVLAIAHSLSALKEFSAGNAFNRSVVVTLPAVTAVLTHSTQLEHLNIGQCVDLTVDCIDVILQRCSGLKVLYLGGLFSATDEDLIKIADGFQQLQHLGIPVSKRLTDRSIRYVAEHCTKLTRVTIPYYVLQQLSKETAKAFPPEVQVRDRPSM